MIKEGPIKIGKAVAIKKLPQFVEFPTLMVNGSFIPNEIVFISRAAKVHKSSICINELFKHFVTQRRFISFDIVGTGRYKTITAAAYIFFEVLRL